MIQLYTRSPVKDLQSQENELGVTPLFHMTCANVFFSEQ